MAAGAKLEPATDSTRWELSPRKVFAILAVFFLLHVVARTLVSGSLQRDEAEQALLTQALRWGYGSQPPLYTWVQKLVFDLCGVNAFSLALFKNSLLFSFYALTYLAARKILRERRDALLAAVSLLFFPTVVWDLQRDRTHLVLATVLSAASLLCALYCVRERRPWQYALLGLLFGAGVISKYNFAPFAVAFLLAAASLPAFRAAVLSWKLGLTVAFFLLLTAPHFHWVFTHPALTLTQTERFYFGAAPGPLQNAAHGLLALLAATLQFVALPVAMYFFAFRGTPPSLPRGADSQLLNLLARTMLFAIGLCAVVILIFQVPRIAIRWAQPLLAALPILLVAWAQPRLTRDRVWLLLRWAGVSMIVVPLILYGSVLLADKTRRPIYLNVPYPAFASAIRADGFTRGTILADETLTGGNLRVQFPDSAVTVPGIIEMKSELDPPLLIAWQGDNPMAEAAMMNHARQLYGVSFTAADVRRVSAEPLYTHATSPANTLSYVLITSRAR